MVASAYKFVAVKGLIHCKSGWRTGKLCCLFKYIKSPCVGMLFLTVAESVYNAHKLQEAARTLHMNERATITISRYKKLHTRSESIVAMQKLWEVATKLLLLQFYEDNSACSVHVWIRRHAPCFDSSTWWNRQDSSIARHDERIQGSNHFRRQKYDEREDNRDS